MKDIAGNPTTKLTLQLTREQRDKRTKESAPKRSPPSKTKTAAPETKPALHHLFSPIKDPRTDREEREERDKQTPSAIAGMNISTNYGCRGIILTCCTNSSTIQFKYAEIYSSTIQFYYTVLL